MSFTTATCRVLCFCLALLLAGCSDGCRRVNPQGHPELPPVKLTPPKPTLDLPRLTVPATVDSTAKLETLATTVKPKQPFVLRWEPPDEHRRKDGTLPTVIFKVVKVRKGKKDLIMTSKLFRGGEDAGKEYDACEVKVEAPDKPGEYRVRVTLTGKDVVEVVSESLLRVE